MTFKHFMVKTKIDIKRIRCKTNPVVNHWRKSVNQNIYLNLRLIVVEVGGVL